MRKTGNRTGITLKLNNLVDNGLVDRLHAALQLPACRLIC